MTSTPSPLEHRVYRPSRLNLLTALAMGGAVLLAPWLAVTIYFAELTAAPAVGIAIMLAGAFLLSVMGYLMAAQVMRNRVILVDGGIDYRWTFGSRHIAATQIAGVRRVDMPRGHFSLQDSGGKRITIAVQFPLDAHFNAWLDRLPDLDAADEAEMTRRIEQNTQLGGNPVARLASAEGAFKTTHYLSIASILLSTWGVFYPAPYIPLVALLALMPAVALGLLWIAPAKYTLRYYDRNDPQANLMLVYFFPAFVLAQRAYYDIYLVPVLPILLPTVLLSVALAAVAGLHKERNWKGLACALAMAAYPAAAIVFINAATERGPELSVMAKVERKGAGDSTSSRYLRIGVGSAMTYPLHVSQTEFARYGEGDAICVRRKEGGLGIAWFTLHEPAACASSSVSATSVALK